MAESDESTSAQWQYAQDWMPDDLSAEDEQNIQRALDRWAANGWELVSANAVQMLRVQSDRTDRHGFPAHTYSTSIMRHYYYWRKPAESDPR